MVLNSKISKVWHGFGTMLNVERQEQKRDRKKLSNLIDNFNQKN